MRVSINIPLKADIIHGGFTIKVAGENDSWKKEQLGEYANKSGVYIHHSNGKILYIGKTTYGEYGNFGERLRREFQLKASGKSKLHQLLASQSKAIRTYCLDLEDLDMMVDPGPMNLTDKRKALIMEQILIGIFNPEGNNV